MHQADHTDPHGHWFNADTWAANNSDVLNLTEAVLAVAAELRTQNLIAFKVAQQTALAECTDAYVAPIRERLGLQK